MELKILPIILESSFSGVVTFGNVTEALAAGDAPAILFGGAVLVIRVVGRLAAGIGLGAGLTDLPLRPALTPLAGEANATFLATPGLAAVLPSRFDGIILLSLVAMRALVAEVFMCVCF